MRQRKDRGKLWPIFLKKSAEKGLSHQTNLFLNESIITLEFYLTPHNSFFLLFNFRKMKFAL